MFTIILISNIIAFFLIGKFHERWEWNRLIQDGKLPKPRKG